MLDTPIPKLSIEDYYMCSFTSPSFASIRMYMCIYIYRVALYCIYLCIPVVPHKAVAEVSE